MTTSPSPSCATTTHSQDKFPTRPCLPIRMSSSPPSTGPSLHTEVKHGVGPHKHGRRSTHTTPTTPHKASFPHVKSYLQGTPGVRRHGRQLLTADSSGIVWATNATVCVIPFGTTRPVLSEWGPDNSPKDACLQQCQELAHACNTVRNRRPESTLHSAELLGEAPGRPPAATTQSQLLRDAHTVMNNSTTVHGYSPRLLTDA
jgi:hypothetical protein